MPASRNGADATAVASFLSRSSQLGIRSPPCVCPFEPQAFACRLGEFNFTTPQEGRPLRGVGLIVFGFRYLLILLSLALHGRRVSLGKSGTHHPRCCGSVRWGCTLGKDDASMAVLDGELTLL